MGPWPILHLWDLVKRGEIEKADELRVELSGPREPGAARPEPAEMPLRPAQFASYCNVGPTRVPYVHFSDATIDRAKKRAAYWESLCVKYRPIVEAERAAATAAV